MNDGAPIDKRDWFTFDVRDDFRPSVVGMEKWLDAPAGKHGFVRMHKSWLRFEDGTPIKFWGVNICNGRVALSKSISREWARKLAKFGVNAVRFHKFTFHGKGKGIGAERVSTKLDPVLAQRFDFFNAQLKARGIYTGWSHIYGHRPRPGDRKRMLAYDEVVNAGTGHLRGSTIGLVNFAPDLQDLAIDLTVGMLRRRNTATGKRYADEPALAYIELQNEDDIFFPTCMDRVNACPTYKKLFCKQFSQWLGKKYRSHRALVRAWGAQAIDAYPEFQTNEHLEANNIYPIAHHWWFSPEGLAGQQRERGTKRRLLDTARFLYETQNRFYRRFARAIRATGYKGCIVGSCWQAGSGVSHFYNLHADTLAGVVDRHNYFGGGKGHDLHTGSNNNAAMVSAPGTGLLSTGFQQVGTRPFFLSEWISRIPNEWVAEGPPLIAAYGLGLQGWDGSFEFAGNTPNHPRTINTPNIYSADSPVQLLQYPAIARMLYRGDLAEGPVISDRKLHIDSLLQDRIGFAETLKQKGDVKHIEGDTPLAALAAGRVQLSFSRDYGRTPKPTLSSYVDKKRQVVTAATGQLSWHYRGKGYFTIDSPGTKGVVGFARGKRLVLGPVSLRIHSPFAVLYVSSLEPDRDIENADRLLITALARARNTGMRYSRNGMHLDRVGGPPIRMEGVRADITLFRRDVPVQAWALDMLGRHRVSTLPIRSSRTGQSFALDGGRYRTVYYEIMVNGQ